MRKKSLTSCFIALIIFTILNLIFLKQVEAQIISPSAVEVTFSYRTAFQLPSEQYVDDLSSAQFHSAHIFGLFSSPKMIKKYGLDPSLVGGLGAPRLQSEIKILASQKISADTIEITYENTGKMILQKAVAKQLLADGQIEIPMPVNPYTIYNEGCTDPHYQTFGDYWYFYDVFRTHCTYLSKAPFAIPVQITIQKIKSSSQKQDSPQLPLLRGDNGNGKLFSIYMVQGFSESKSNPTDEGRQNFTEMNNYFLEQGFAMETVKLKTPYPYYRFSKTLKLNNGKEVFIQVNHLLVETALEARSKLFADFFREAVSEGDVIIYGGHSGLGANLDIPSLEAKVGPFQFNPQKKQIFYFDSCSSYSYYLDLFANQKTKAKIDIMTNGLSSYFEASQMTVKIFLGYLISKDNRDIKWSTILSNMESVLDGGTYLLNVGGI